MPLGFRDTVPSGAVLLQIRACFRWFFLAAFQDSLKKRINGNMKKLGDSGQDGNIGKGFSAFPFTDCLGRNSQSICQRFLAQISVKAELPDGLWDGYMHTNRSFPESFPGEGCAYPRSLSFILSLNMSLCNGRIREGISTAG